MKELFPLKQITGFVTSLALTVAALAVYFLELSFGVAMTILLVTAFAQAGLQFVVFMHAGETGDKKVIYSSIYYGMFIAIVSIFGTLLAMTWGYF